MATATQTSRSAPPIDDAERERLAEVARRDAAEATRGGGYRERISRERPLTVGQRLRGAAKSTAIDTGKGAARAVHWTMSRPLVWGCAAVMSVVLVNPAPLIAMGVYHAGVRGKRHYQALGPQRQQGGRESSYNRSGSRGRSDNSGRGTGIERALQAANERIAELERLVREDINNVRHPSNVAQPVAEFGRTVVDNARQAARTGTQPDRSAQAPTAPADPGVGQPPPGPARTNPAAGKSAGDDATVLPFQNDPRERGCSETLMTVLRMDSRSATEATEALALAGDDPRRALNALMQTDLATNVLVQVMAEPGHPQGHMTRKAIDVLSNALPGKRRLEPETRYALAEAVNDADHLIEDRAVAQQIMAGLQADPQGAALVTASRNSLPRPDNQGQFALDIVNHVFHRNQGPATEALERTVRIAYERNDRSQYELDAAIAAVSNTTGNNFRTSVTNGVTAVRDAVDGLPRGHQPKRILDLKDFPTPANDGERLSYRDNYSAKVILDKVRERNANLGPIIDAALDRASDPNPDHQLPGAYPQPHLHTLDTMMSPNVLGANERAQFQRAVIETLTEARATAGTSRDPNREFDQAVSTLITSGDDYVPGHAIMSGNTRVGLMDARTEAKKAAPEHAPDTGKATGRGVA